MTRHVWRWKKMSESRAWGSWPFRVGCQRLLARFQEEWQWANGPGRVIHTSLPAETNAVFSRVLVEKTKVAALSSLMIT